MSDKRNDDAKGHVDDEQQASPSTGISRGALLAAGGAAAAVPLLSGRIALAGDSDEYDELKKIYKLGATREAYWRSNGAYFQQKNVDATKVDKGIIRARVDGSWQEFVIRECDDDFFKFNIDMRTRMMDVMAGGKALTMYNDAHNAAVGTYGGNRGDSRFHVNVAFKGMGWLPKANLLDARIKDLEANYTQSTMKKMQILYAGYQDAAKWDRRLQVSLELYTTMDNETHSFLNQMVNPVSTICFLGDESYEFRTIARLLHHRDPTLTSYEKQVVKYINYAHDFFHGGPDPTKLTVHNIGVIYYIVEEFDNSPFGKTPTAGGKKKVPSI